MAAGRPKVMLKVLYSQFGPSCSIHLLTCLALHSSTKYASETPVLEDQMFEMRVENEAQVAKHLSLLIHEHSIPAQTSEYLASIDPPEDEIEL